MFQLPLKPNRKKKKKGWGNNSLGQSPFTWGKNGIQVLKDAI